MVVSNEMIRGKGGGGERWGWGVCDLCANTWGHWTTRCSLSQVVDTHYCHLDYSDSSEEKDANSKL